MTLDRETAPSVGDIVCYHNPDITKKYRDRDDVWLRRHNERWAYIVVETAYDDSVDEGGTARCVRLGNREEMAWTSDEMYVPPGRLMVLNAATYDPPFEGAPPIPWDPPPIN